MLYAKADCSEPFQIIALDPEQNRSFFFWHVFVDGLPAGTYYTWRADGPKDAALTGRRFTPNKELLDPWARTVSDVLWDRRRAGESRDATGGLRAIVVEPLAPLSPPIAAPLRQADLEGAVIYELHVGGFTRHPSSGVAQPGRFAGLKEKIPYLRELGVTHVELLPVMAFDAQDVPPSVAARGLRNYWGYSTHSFWAPQPEFCIDPARAPAEFRDLVDALHDAGISVLMDVVFNHTAEGGKDGPVINFKGLVNEIVYHLDSTDRRRYLDYTGCGNTLNCNHPLVTKYIVDCLEYWVETLGVDGFRFDLASVFARDEQGVPMANPPLPWNIESSRILSQVSVIAEAWDAAGLYQVGSFPGMGWAEWNGRYRDVIRRFVRGDPGLIGEVATRVAGSADLYAGGQRKPANSVNLITCHDGFTLHDLVSYNGKHNEANGEDNRDGSDNNLSWNCGAEGDTADPVVRSLRRRQAKNLLAILMLSRGVPMLLAGDEVLRTQGGNNNGWCQDNGVSWFDWRLLETNREMLRYTRKLIALRRRHPNLTVNRYFTDAPVPGRGIPGVAWHGLRLYEPLWHDNQARLLAYTLAGLSAEEEDLHVILNMSEQALDMPLPPIPGRRWHIALDTAQIPPLDIVARSRQVPLVAAQYRVDARSVVVLESRGDGS